jgi:rhodanese-related sulfurtransferase
MKHISPKELHTALQDCCDDHAVDFINVCTPAEYKERSIPGVRNVPLDELAAHLNEFTDKERIYVHCRSGKRAAQAIAQLKELGVTADMFNVEGGLVAWHEAGLPTEVSTSRMPIMRQVLLVAGTLVLIGVGLGWFMHPYWFALSAFVGAGLSFAGLTGWCGMSMLLAKMPWNR